MRAAAVQVQRPDELMDEINSLYSLCFSLFKGSKHCQPQLGSFKECDFDEAVSPDFIAKLNKQSNRFLSVLEIVRSKRAQEAFPEALYDDLTSCTDCLVEVTAMLHGTYKHELTIRTLLQRYSNFVEKVLGVSIADFLKIGVCT